MSVTDITEAAIPKISGVVITRNEEQHLGECLQSMNWVDEIIVVDAESQDRTVDIARQFTDQVYVRPWEGFPSQRNFGISKATGEWILILDADERVTVEARQEIAQWIRSPEAREYAAGFVPRRNIVFGRWLRFGGVYPDKQCRLLKMGRVWYDENTLDTPVINGRPKFFLNRFDHFTGRTLSSRIGKINRQSNYKALERLEKKRTVGLSDILFRPLFSFGKVYVFKQGFRDGMEGFLYAGLASLHTFLCYGKLWEFLGTRPKILKGSHPESPPDMSVVVITKNEEHNIEACLSSVRWAKEIIVVDAESTDRTVLLAKRFTDDVFVRPWQGFGPQKNFAIDQVQSRWVLILDADERGSPKLKEEICGLLHHESFSGIVGYQIPRRNFFYGTWIQQSGMFPDYQLRLFKKSAGRYDQTLIHENLKITGPQGWLETPLDHHTTLSIRHHIQKMRQYTSLAADQKLKEEGRVRFLDLAGSHLVNLLKTYILRSGWKDGIPGLVVAFFAGMYTFVKYAKAHEVLEKRKGEGADRECALDLMPRR